MPLFRYLKIECPHKEYGNLCKCCIYAFHFDFKNNENIPSTARLHKKKQKSLSTKTTYIYVLDPRIPFSLLNQSICKNVKRRILSIEPIQIFIVHLTNKRERERRYMIIISLKKDFYR